MYGNRVADESTSKFNVTWSRVSPVCVSLCNDYNCLYITGDSNHILGREAVGNASGVWSFNFATSFSFSLIFSSNGYIFIKHASDNSTLLFLDLKTGIVRDCFSYYGVLGTMPCYHDNITDNAWKYGNNLLDKVSKEFSDLKIIFGISMAVTDLVGNGLLFEGLGSILAGTTEVLAGISLGTAVVITIPLFIVLFPDYANALWKDFMYLLNPNYKEYPNIPIYENNNYYNNQILVLNIQLLDDYTKSQFIRAYSDENFDWKNVDYYHCVNILNYNYKFAPGGPKPINESFFEVGKFIKEDVDLLVRDIVNSNYKGIIKNIAKIGIAVYLTSLTILHYLKTLIKK